MAPHEMQVLSNHVQLLTEHSKREFIKISDKLRKAKLFPRRLETVVFQQARAHKALMSDVK